MLRHRWRISRRQWAAQPDWLLFPDAVQEGWGLSAFAEPMWNSMQEVGGTERREIPMEYFAKTVEFFLTTYAQPEGIPVLRNGIFQDAAREAGWNASVACFYPLLKVAA